jgi:NADPH:quinone reductase-like Zn-dependent oxidoreductase
MSESLSRAVRLTEGTAPADLTVSEVPRPAPSSGEVLVAVHAAAINRVDAVNTRGLIPLTSFPRVPGRDFAGVVVEGPAESVGKEVWGTGGGDLGFTRDGSHAQHLLLPHDALVPKPANMSFDEAGSAGLVFLAAAMALERAGTLRAGAAVLVTGAVGGVGSAVVSLAKSRGARVIGAVSGAAECRVANDTGIDSVIDTQEGDLADAVMDSTDGQGADLAVDTVGAPLLNAVIAAMGFDGSVCFLAAQGHARVDFDPQNFYRRDLRLAGLNTTRITTAEAAAILRPLIPAFERGQLVPPRVAAGYPLEDAAAAYAAVEDGTSDRVVLHPNG